jgi:hypothetical protein
LSSFFSSLVTSPLSLPILSSVPIFRHTKMPLLPSPYLSSLSSLSPLSSPCINSPSLSSLLSRRTPPSSTAPSAYTLSRITSNAYGPLPTSSSPTPAGARGCTTTAKRPAHCMEVRTHTLTLAHTSNTYMVAYS